MTRYGPEWNTWEPESNLTAKGMYENSHLRVYWQSVMRDCPRGNPHSKPKPTVECAGSPSDLVRYPSIVRTLMGTKRGRLELEGGGM